MSGNDSKITFIDINTEVINLVNNLREYPVFTVSEKGMSESTVSNIAGLNFYQEEEIINKIIETDLILTAVGKNALIHVAPLLAKGLVLRTKKRPKNEIYVVVIACENVQDNSSYLEKLILNNIPKEYLKLFNDYISFPNCVVDRIVPDNVSLDNKNMLAVTVEEYHQFAIDKKGLKSPFPKIQGVELSQDLKAILEQKLFTLNMGHAIIAYYGYKKGCEYVHEAMREKDILELFEGSLDEVSNMITARHETITKQEQTNYVEKIIKRFNNPYLKDQITRVGRDPVRKLGPNDRLIMPANIILDQGNLPICIATGISAALKYDYSNDPQAKKLTEEINTKGIKKVLEEISGISEETDISKLINTNCLFAYL